MANVASALKRNRQRLKRRVRNLHHLTTTRSLAKRASAATKKRDPAAPEVVKEAASQLSRAATKGVIKKKTASRKISRLALALAKAQAAPAPVAAATGHKKGKQAKPAKAARPAKS